MVDHAVGLALQRNRRRLALGAHPGRPRRVLARGTRRLDLVLGLFQRRHKRRRRRRVGRNVLLAQVRMEREMLDVVLGMVPRVVRLERHAVVTHALVAVPAELGVARARNRAGLLFPENVHRILHDALPGPRAAGGRGRRHVRLRLACAAFGTRLVRGIQEMAVSGE